MLLKIMTTVNTWSSNDAAVATDFWLGGDGAIEKSPISTV